MSDKEILEARITHGQMAEAVARSGYLLEQRVFPTIEKAGFYVETNPVFADPVTGKSREYDFSALSVIRIYRENWDFLRIHLIGECVNNPQPIVFFSHEEWRARFVFHLDLKCSGIPLKFPWAEDKGKATMFQDFFHLNKFHHYCQGRYSTQYCSFHHKSGKSEWLAWHDEEHHGLFDTLMVATQYEMNSFFSSWMPPENEEDGPLSLNLFYPLLIMRNELYECEQKKGKPVFTRRDHLQFRKPVVLAGQQETFHIDVITETHLASYLKLLQQEHEELATRMKRKKKEVRAAIGEIVAQARAAKREGKPKDFRDVLQY